MRHPNSQAFHDTLDLMGETHDLKQADYGRADDPFANVRASEDFGMPGWVGAIVRANDKMRRLQKAAQQVLAGEKVSMELDGPLDDLLDLAVYAVIARVLYQEGAIFHGEAISFEGALAAAVDPTLAPNEVRFNGQVIVLDPYLRPDEVRSFDPGIQENEATEQYLASLDEVKTARENLRESVEAWRHDSGYSE